MLKVSAGHYRDTFRRTVYDVKKLNVGWVYTMPNQDDGLMSSIYETKAEARTGAIRQIDWQLDHPTA